LFHLEFLIIPTILNSVKGAFVDRFAANP